MEAAGNRKRTDAGVNETTKKEGRKQNIYKEDKPESIIEGEQQLSTQHLIFVGF